MSEDTTHAQETWEHHVVVTQTTVWRYAVNVDGNPFLRSTRQQACDAARQRWDSEDRPTPRISDVKVMQSFASGPVIEP